MQLSAFSAASFSMLPGHSFAQPSALSVDGLGWVSRVQGHQKSVCADRVLFVFSDSHIFAEFAGLLP